MERERWPTGNTHLSQTTEGDRGEQTDDPLPLMFRETPAQIAARKVKKYSVRVTSFPEAALCRDGFVGVTLTTNRENGEGGRKQIIHPPFPRSCSAIVDSSLSEV